MLLFKFDKRVEQELISKWIRYSSYLDILFGDKQTLVVTWSYASVSRADQSGLLPGTNYVQIPQEQPENY